MTYCKTDKHIGGGIYLSAASLLNKRYRNKALTVATVVNHTIDEFRKHLEFPQDVIVRIAPVKGTVNGRYYSTSKMVELDCRLAWDKALEVLAHELVHAEQYFQGRLKKEYIRGKGWVHSWNDNLSKNRGSTYRAYRNQPWEQEAWARQGELAEKVHRALEKQYA